MYRREDRLLYVLSAARTCTWSAFKRAFVNLALRDFDRRLGHDGALSMGRLRTVNTLQALGHCDIDWSDNPARLSVGRPMLTRLPVRGLPQAALSGARFEDTIERLRTESKRRGLGISVGVDVHPAAPPLVPCRVALEADTDEHLRSLAEATGFGYSPTPPSWTILHFAGSIAEYMQTCSWEQVRELGWERKTFDRGRLFFVPGDLKLAGSELKSYSDPVRGTSVHRLWDGDQSANVDRDWGRYEILRRHARSVLVYDVRHCRLAVPSTVPLPKLLARAAGLCSGYAPGRIFGANLPLDCGPSLVFDVYRGVPQGTAERIAEKVGQSMIRHEIQDDEGGVRK